MAALREILAYFKVDVDTKDLTEATKGVDTFSGKLGSVANAIGQAFGPVALGYLKGFVAVFGAAAAAYGVDRFIQGQIDAAKELQVTSERLGIGVQELQAWHLAAQETGVDVQQMDTALRFLNRSLGNAELGNKAMIKTFGQLGVSAKGQGDNLTDFAEGLADRFAGLKTQAERTALAMKLFGRGGASILPILQQGSERVKAMFNDVKALGGGLSTGFVQRAREAQRAQVRLGFAMTGLKSQVTDALLPMFSLIIEKLTRWTVAFDNLIKKTYVIQEVILGLKLAVASLLIAFFPMTVIVASFAALIVLLDDLYTTLEGGDSLIRRWFDGLYGIGTTAKFVDKVKAAFENLAIFFETRWPAISNQLQALAMDIVNYFGAATRTVWDLYKAFLETFSLAGHFYKALSAGATGHFKEAGEEFKNVWQSAKNIGSNFKTAGSGLVDVGHAVTKGYKDTQDNWINNPTPANSIPAGQQFGPPPPPGWRAAGGNQSNKIEINNNFHGKVDPTQVQGAARSGVEEGLRQSDYRRAFDAVGTGSGGDE